MARPERNIMILGAGIYQVPLITKARDLGFTTLVLSVDGNYPGIALADTFFAINTVDVNRVVAVAREHAIRAIVTSGTDVCLPALGAVVDDLGLSGPGRHSAELSQNKIKMKSRFTRFGVPTAPFHSCRNLDELKRAAHQLGFPVMVKAADSSGSRGITKVSTADRLEPAWRNALAATRLPEIIVETCLSGEEFGAQAIVYGHKLDRVYFHNDTVTAPPVSTPIGHSIPCKIPAATLAQAESAIEKAVHALQIRDAICNVDLILADGKPMIIEIGARMGATCLPETIGIYAGFDPYEQLIEMALGHHPTLSAPSGRPNASRLLVSQRDGYLGDMQVPSDISRDRRLVRLALDYQRGDAVRAFKVGADRIGELIVTEKNAGDAERLADTWANEIAIDVEQRRL